MAFNRHALTAVRLASGLSKSAFATRVGVSPGYLLELEDGTKVNPSIRVLRSIARTFDFDARALDPNAKELKNQIRL